MLVVMQEGATEAQTEAVIDRLVEMGFTVHRSTGVRHTVLGGVGPQEGSGGPGPPCEDGGRGTRGAAR